MLKAFMVLGYGHMVSISVRVLSLFYFSEADCSQRYGA